MDMTRYEELAKDQAFLNALADAETPEAMQKLFADHGIELTMDEVNAFIRLAENGKSGELNENDLANVSGGCDPLTSGLIIIGLALYAMWKYRKRK